MPQVKVWNDNTHPYHEEFREQKIKIPPKGFITMEAGEAHLFKGSFSPVKLDADGNPTPEGFKMIRIEEINAAAEVDAEPAKFVCQADGAEFDTEAELAAYIKENHADKIVVDEEAEKEIAKRRGAKKK